jgi:hypothetical protein
MILQKNYKAHLVAPMWSWTTWEIEIQLSEDVDSETWYLLIDPATSNAETLFWHRRTWNSIWCYGINRDNPVAHITNTNVILSNSIDYLNNLLLRVPEQLFTYYKDANNFILKWWLFFISSQMVTLSDLDTSESLPNKTLTAWTTNYVYIDITNFTFKITTTLDTWNYLVATVVTWVWWNITSFTKNNVFHIWTIWPTWETWLQWPTWSVWPTWPTWPTWVWISTITLLSTVWLIDTYRITYTDTSTQDFVINNWADWTPIEVQSDWTHIQWRYVWWSTWTNIVVLESLRWPQWSIWSPWVIQYIQDKTNLSWTITTDWTAHTITQTNADWSTTVSSETWIIKYDINWNIVSKTDATWVYDTWVITYTSIPKVVDSVTWTETIVDWTIAYTNKDNEFTWVNTYKWMSVFKSWVSFPYWAMSVVWTTITFDANNWCKQKCSVTWTSAYTINFINLSHWTNYEFAILSSWAATINIWTASWLWWISLWKYSIGSQAYPITMSSWWPFLFCCDVFTTWIHIAYLWKSTAL